VSALCLPDLASIRIMPNLLAMSFEGDLVPSFDLQCLSDGQKAPDGWGLGYYPGSGPSATLLREGAPTQGSRLGELVKAGDHLAASIFVLHLRTASWGAAIEANTQPFLRSHAGREVLLGHSGSLEHRLPELPNAAFEPTGSTDSEILLCRLMSLLAASGTRTLGELDPVVFGRWLADLNTQGSLTLAVTDGHDLFLYADANGNGELHLWSVAPPYERLQFGDADVQIDLTSNGVKRRKGIIASSAPLESTSDIPVAWTRVAPGHLIIVREGAIRAEHAPDGTLAESSPARQRRPAIAEVKRLDVCHRTVYRYANPVEKSFHMLRVVPFHDRMQTLLEHRLFVSVGGEEVAYEDVFGNQARKIHLSQPFTELVIEARSRVELLDVDPLSFRRLRTRTTIPLVWMPWQRHMLQPYLLPPELPESQLVDLSEYAMSFVRRNDYDILDTLLDLNWTIYKEYAYRQGSTTNATTAFEVFLNRQGVCQDFANLFICLARLLGVPARYVCGYLHTGPKHENTAQAEASHAWVQVYLPEVGWKGFDPTNGILTQTDHVRVAVGRSYVDATPTGGAIFRVGGGETLEVAVTCELAK
jgi:transglutaminase-like putative cysteine protease/predicted glutamine amidotransferase